MTRFTLPRPALALAGALLTVPVPAIAYMGPGAGLGALGTLLALVGAVVLAAVGFVRYPVKRLPRRNRKSREARVAGARPGE